MSKETDLSKEFLALRPFYEAFTICASDAIKRVLEENGVQPFSYEFRTKTIESLSEKLERPSKEGKYECLGDITDISGLRFIGYLGEDCHRANELLRKHFIIDEERSIDKLEELGDDRFGYQSNHLILSFSAERCMLPEFTKFSGLKIEVQIKTLLQHTWAAIDWKLRYKGGYDTPKPLRRRLNRISALLEAADDEFSFLSNQSNIIRMDYEKSINSGNLSIGIDLDSIDTLLNSSRTLKVVQLLSGKIENFSLRDSENKNHNYLLSVLNFCNINSIKDLDNILHDGIEENSVKIANSFKNWHSGKRIVTTRDSIVLIRFILSLPRDVATEAMRKTKFKPDYQEALLQEISDLPESDI